MRPIAMALLLLCAGPQLPAQDGESDAPVSETEFGNLKARMAQRKHNKAVEAAATEFTERVARARKEYRRDLARAKSDAMKREKLEDAVAIQKEIDLFAEETVHRTRGPVNHALAANGAKVHGATQAVFTNDGILDGHTNSGGHCYCKLGKSITVELDADRRIDVVRFRLWDLDDRLYRYKLWGSRNNQDWKLIEDASETGKRSWVTIPTEGKKYRYLRTESFGNTVNPSLALVEFEAWEGKPPTIVGK